MKHLLYIFLFVFLAACSRKKSFSTKDIYQDSTPFRKLTESERAYYKQALFHAYDSLLLRGRFNGGIIVAKNGEVLLEEYVGYSNFATNDTITANTPFHVASVSKTFTGMAVLKLWEQGKLQLEDSIQKFFPGFPYPGITIKMLLNHRSGLPNYVYFMPADTAWSYRKRGHIATNNDMLEFIETHKPSVDNGPDRTFHYCNTNFAMLALVIEKVSGQRFPEFMRDNVFTPLGMKNTFIFSISDTANYKPSYLFPNKPIALENIDCIYGDKNVYTTARDLLLWDKALYQNTFVKKSTFDTATRGYSFEKPGIHNYGLGWRLMLMPDRKVVYHNGWWHGNNAVFARMLKDTVTIIITGNRYSPNIYRGIHLDRVFSNSTSQEQKQEE